MFLIIIGKTNANSWKNTSWKYETDKYKHVIRNLFRLKTEG